MVQMLSLWVRKSKTLEKLMILVIVNVVEKAVSREITNLWRFIIVTPETNSIQQFLSPVLTAYSLVVLR
ncbi:MAG: hypothetical protein V3S97_10875 [Candidatus Bathyarchaeia archaeon]